MDARHPSRPPDVEALLGVLEEYGVRFVLSGSVAAAAYGVDLEPGDLDIVPDTGTGNLRRVVDALENLEARPHGPFGDWTVQDSGEWKWIPRPTSEAELASWKPDPEDVRSLDHLYLTRLGNLDVVPEITGTYEHLSRRCRALPLHGFVVQVAHVDELLARLTVPRRDKDATRVAKLRRIQASLPRPPR